MKTNVFNKYNDLKVEEINKSDIYQAVKYNNTDSPLIVEKSGVEIKKQINDVLLPYFEKEYNLCIEKIEGLKEGIGKEPVGEEEIVMYGLKLDIPYKPYNWKETTYMATEESSPVLDIFNNFANIVGDSEDLPLEEMEEKIKDALEEEEKIKQSKEYANSLEEVDKRVEYNKAIYSLCEIQIDILTLEALKNLKDDVIYKLDIQQVIALKF